MSPLVGEHATDHGDGIILKMPKCARGATLAKQGKRQSGGNAANGQKQLKMRCGRFSPKRNFPVAPSIELPSWDREENLGQIGNLLSPAEEVVCVNMYQGLSNREIAAPLVKSEIAVKNQVSAILAKRAAIIRAALICG